MFQSVLIFKGQIKIKHSFSHTHKIMYFNNATLNKRFFFGTIKINKTFCFNWNFKVCERENQKELVTINLERGIKER